MTLTIGEILPAAAQRFGNKTAVIVEGRAFAFRQLDELSNRAANGLVAADVRPGDRVTAVRAELLGVACRPSHYFGVGA